MRGSFSAPHHHDPNEMLPNFAFWVMVVAPSGQTVQHSDGDSFFDCVCRHSGILVAEENCVVAVLLARLKNCKKSEIMVSSSSQPIRLGGGYTVALAPHFQGPRPKDRRSVGSALVCRWPPGGVSGALRPPQSPQDSGDTSLTSLWQPHRKVKQRGGKTRVSGLLLGGRCAGGHKNPLTLTPCFLSGVFPFSSDSVCKWWSHVSEGSLSPWPTTRGPTPELEEGCLRDIPGCRRSPRIFTPRAPTPELATTGRHVYAQ